MTNSHGKDHPTPQEHPTIYKFNTECKHAIDCDWYHAAAIRALAADPAGEKKGDK